MDMTDAERKEYFDWLDDLRESGECNMYASRPYLQDEFPELGKREAGAIVVEWMETYTKRHP